MTPAAKTRRQAERRSRVRAAQLGAERLFSDLVTDEVLALSLGITVRQLYRWRRADPQIDRPRWRVRRVVRGA